MNFDLDEQQLMFERTIERFVAGSPGAVRGADFRSGEAAAARWLELAELGLLALPASEAAGGIGGRPEDLVVAAQAMGKSLAADPWLECAHFPLRLLDAMPGCDGWALRIISGEQKVAVAFAEPAARYALDPRQVRARRSGDAWTLSGEKRFVLGGASADTYFVTAANDGGAALFAVRSADAEARPYRLVDGSEAVVLTLRDCPGERLGPLEPAFTAAVTETKLAAAAEMVGLATHLLDDTLVYARERTQFGKPLASFQALQHRLVDCYAMLEQSRSMLWRAALTERDPDGRWMATIAGAKAFIAERALQIGHEAIQMHGGMGMSEELSIGHAHKRNLLLSRLFGDPATELASLAIAA